MQHKAAIETVTATAKSLGLEPFYRTFHNKLTIIPENDASLIVSEHDYDVFDSSWLGREFVALRAHLNKDEYPKTGLEYFPGIIGSRYAKVIEVVDARSVRVDFIYNGGNRKPKKNEHASGYFFQDIGPRLKQIIEARTDRNSGYAGLQCIEFEPENCYVFKGLPGIELSLKNFPLILRCSYRQQRTWFKISAEDNLTITENGHGVGRILNPPFFQLDDGCNDLIFHNIDIFGPHYSVRTIQHDWGNALIRYDESRQCERKIIIKNCHANREADGLRELGEAPEGATFLSPPLFYSAGGGTHDGHDITGYQRFIIDNCSWHARSITELKNNNGGGNFLEVNSSELADAEQVKITRFEKVKVSLENEKYNGKDELIVKAESSDFQWYSVANQYWSGSSYAADLLLLCIGGWELYFGNNADWRIYHNPQKILRHAIKDTHKARLFDKIPSLGDPLEFTVFHHEQQNQNTLFLWGWGLQVDDQIKINNTVYTVRKRERTTRKDDDWPEIPIHGWAVWLDTELSKIKPDTHPGDKIQAKVVHSQTQALLNHTHTADVVYKHQSFGHLFYNREQVGYSFRDSDLRGYFRISSGLAPNSTATDLWNYPKTMEYIRSTHLPDKNSTNVGAQGGTSVLKIRSELEGGGNRRILVEGGKLYMSRNKAELSEVEFRNRPTLIHGGLSVGEPRLLNPIIDGQGLIATAGLSVQVSDNHSVDLSNTCLENGKDLLLSGHGKFTLDHLELTKRPDSSNYFGRIVFAEFTGAEHYGNKGFQLYIKGNLGRGGLYLDAADTEEFKNRVESEHNQLVLTKWKLKPGSGLPEGKVRLPKHWEPETGSVIVNGKKY